MNEFPAVKEKEKPVRSPELSERRYVYGGTPPRRVKETIPVKGNRKTRRQQGSLFYIIVCLVVASLLIVFYVWNKITVNRLVVEVNDMQNQYQKILNANEFLRAEINRKSSLERIGKIATTQLGLIYPKEQPVWFEVPVDRFDQLPAESSAGTQ